MNNKKETSTNDNELSKTDDEEKKNLNKNSVFNCNHSYTIDYIDITPERSERIVYCKKCLITK